MGGGAQAEAAEAKERNVMLTQEHLIPGVENHHQVWRQQGSEGCRGLCECDPGGPTQLDPYITLGRQPETAATVPKVGRWPTESWMALDRATGGLTWRGQDLGSTSAWAGVERDNRLANEPP